MGELVLTKAFPRSHYGNICLSLLLTHPTFIPPSGLPPAPLLFESLIFEKAVRVSEGLKLEG